jgi:isochorismate synthase EntC
VVHLETPISATLPDGVGVVDLVDALHPTPAVCGTPTEAARGMIRQLEPFDRGLYAGAVGWTNLAGEGDVTVALRCGLLRDRWAHLFAGGGITADSEVDEEVAETESKFMPVLEALREAVA